MSVSLAPSSQVTLCLLVCLNKIKLSLKFLFTVKLVEEPRSHGYRVKLGLTRLLSLIQRVAVLQTMMTMRSQVMKMTKRMTQRMTVLKIKLSPITADWTLAWLHDSTILSIGHYVTI